MAILKRPMFRKGGSTNEGIMHGLERRGYADSNWEDLAKTYNISGSERFSGESDLYKNIDPNLINTGEGGYGTNWFKWLHDRGPDEPSTLVQSIFEEAQKSKTVPPEAIAGYKIPIPEGRPKEKIDTGNGTGTGTGTGTIDDISISDLNKERMKIFAPHMQKRMVADALGAASESFEKSTGNTKQDIARALGAAGRAMRGTTDLADQVSLLTLKGEIEKDIESSKKIKPSNFESAVTAWMDIKDAKGEPKYSLEEALEKASGTKTESTRFYEIQEKFGKGEAIADQQKNNPKFWGSYNKLDKRELKKLPDEAIGMIIYDETENSFYTITVDDEGTKKKEFLSRA